MRRVAAIVGLGMAVLLVAGGAGATPAHAKAYWARGAEARLPGNAATDGQFAQIDNLSCPSPANCGAAGDYVDRAGNTQGLLLSETAGKWAAGVEAVLPGKSDPALPVAMDDISCASAGNCTAVGYYFDHKHLLGLMLTETAGVWAKGVRPALPTNAAAHAGGSAEYVSCTSPGNCTAVGDYHNGAGNDEPLLLTETNGVWAKGVEPALPAGAARKNQQASLGGVSCPSAGNCTAVGQFYDKAGAAQAMVMGETAGSWHSATEVKLPANAAHPHDAEHEVSVLLGPVACASPGNCSGVGFYDAGRRGTQGLVVTEQNGTWGAGVEVRLPAHAAANQNVGIGSISCASAGNCSAVGSYWDTEGHDQLLLLTESAGTWLRGVRASLPANATTAEEYFPYLYSISCPTAGSCVAAGAYTTRRYKNTVPLMLTQTDGVWTRGIPVALPMNATGDYQESEATVSCASIQSCTVVGEYATGSAWQGLVADGPAPVSLVEVPHVRGKTVAAAKRLIRSQGCSVGTVTHVQAGRGEIGRVISQSPKSGRTVRPGTKINLRVSSG